MMTYCHHFFVKKKMFSHLLKDYAFFFLFNKTTTIIIKTSIAAAQIPAVGNNCGFVKALVHIAIFLIKIASAYPDVPAPIRASIALNHLGNTSVKRIAVIKQISAINTQITKCIE